MTAIAKPVEVEDLWYEFYNFPGLFTKTNNTDDKRTEDFEVVCLRLKRTLSDRETITRKKGEEFLVIHYEELERYIKKEKSCTG